MASVMAVAGIIMLPDPPVIDFKVTFNESYLESNYLNPKDRELAKEIVTILERKPIHLDAWSAWDDEGNPNWNPYEISNAHIVIDYSKTVEMAKSIEDKIARSLVLTKSIGVLLGTDHPAAFRALDLIPLEDYREIAHAKIVRHFEDVKVPLPEHLKKKQES